MENSWDAPLRALAERLKLTRPLAFLDLETTGLSTEADRIVEIAVIAVHPDGRVTRFEQIFNPQVPIPPEATAVHGIGDDDVRDAPTFRALAPALVAMLAGCDFAGFNIARYDLKMLAAELARADVAFPLNEARVVDAMTIYHRNERRDLTAAVRFYRERVHKGHRAAEDVYAVIDVLGAQLDRYPALPTDVDRLADYCEARQPDWLTSDGRFAWRDGAARITFGKHVGKSLATLVAQEADYLRWLLEKDFPADLKKIVAEAFEGRFPVGR